MKGLVRRNVKGFTTDSFLSQLWFSSKRSDEAMMNVCDDIIGIVKTNTKVFCKGSVYYQNNY